MTRANTDNTKKILLTTLILLLSALACVVPVATTVPDNTPTPKAVLAKATKTPGKSADNTSTTVTIAQAVVTVRKSPGGEASGDYVYSGDRVELSGKCVKDWCPVSKPVKGWIWRGCLSEIADGLLCLAKP